MEFKTEIIECAELQFSKWQKGDQWPFSIELYAYLTNFKALW